MRHFVLSSFFCPSSLQMTHLFDPSHAALRPTLPPCRSAVLFSHAHVCCSLVFATHRLHGGAGAVRAQHREDGPFRQSGRLYVSCCVYRPGFTFPSPLVLISPVFARFALLLVFISRVDVCGLQTLTSSSRTTPRKSGRCVVASSDWCCWRFSVSPAPPSSC